MSIDAINNTLFSMQTQSMELKTKPQETFSPTLSQALEANIVETNDQLNAAAHALAQLASGHAENLHQTMITMEQAKLSFQYLEQIRNRLMSAYQDLLREQI